MYCHGRFWVLHVAFGKWHSPGRVVHNWVIAPQRHARQTLPAKPLFPYAWAIPSAALFQQLWNDPTRFSDRSANHSQHRPCSNGWSSWALWETPSSRDRKPTVSLVRSASVSLDSSSSRNAILSPFPVIFLKNIETFLVFCARCLLFQPLWWIWMWIVRADSSFFFQLSASLAFFCEVAEAGGFHPGSRRRTCRTTRKRLLFAAAPARRGSVLCGSLLEGTIVWKHSPRGHPCDAWHALEAKTCLREGSGESKR